MSAYTRRTVRTLAGLTAVIIAAAVLVIAVGEIGADAGWWR